MSQYPEHDKVAAIADRTQAIGEFLKWVMDNYHCELGRPEGRDASFRPVARPINELLAEWAGIDLDALEREKRAMLDDLRKRQPAGDDR